MEGVIGVILSCFRIVSDFDEAVFGVATSHDIRRFLFLEVDCIVLIFASHGGLSLLRVDVTISLHSLS